MYFKCSIRRHPITGDIAGYYRLVESYRNADGRICHRTILNVGFMEDDTTTLQRQKIQQHLTDKYELQQHIFEEQDPIVIKYVNTLWQRIIAEKRLDIASLEKRKRMIDTDTIKHSNVREIGAERMAYDAWKKLGIDEILQAKCWGEEAIQLAATEVISRAVYPASELKTTRWIQDNSAICELTGYPINNITKDKLYQSSLKLYGVKDALEKHLSNRTNELFDLTDKIILYDLTNTYFEGRKTKSKLAKFGRSKEKRSDAKLVVLALVINVEGFIKYSSIHEGNITDCKTLSQMIDKLAAHTCSQKAIVVLDAGIATDENLALITQKGYEYLCVSRSKLKDYEVVKDRITVLLETKSKQTVQLKTIKTDKDTNYYLQVKSEAKAKKEEAMNTQFAQRFELELQRIQKSIIKKGGIKKIEKVWERIGRAKQKYPSIHTQYHIDVTTDETKKMATAMQFEKDENLQTTKQSEYGMYFLRSSLNLKDEVVVWNIYNTIREIETTFRTLKTELDLRPIYHKNDDATMAHLHLGLLAYWLVNTIRHQLKAHGIHHCWGEIVRIGNTQKIITTTGKNTFDKTVGTRKCSEPNEQLSQLFNILKMPTRPFRKLKFVVHKPTPKKN